jgi:hypothetical protein
LFERMMRDRNGRNNPDPDQDMSASAGQFAMDGAGAA